MVHRALVKDQMRLVPHTHTKVFYATLKLRVAVESLV